MAGLGGHHALGGVQQQVNGQLIGLGAAGDEKHLGLRGLAGRPDLFGGFGAVMVGSVAGHLLQIGAGERLQNAGVAALAVIVFKRKHGNLFLAMAAGWFVGDSAKMLSGKL